MITIILSFLKKVLIEKMCNAFDSSYNFINQQLIEFEQRQTIKTQLKILDVGCGNGNITPKLIKFLDKPIIHGLDALIKIKNKNIIYHKIDLEKNKFPFKKNFFDIIIISQTIEHILNKDFLLEESFRVLKKKGLFVCATENICSFDNIFSLILGQEPLVQHTGSKYYSHSNLSPHFMTKVLHKTGNKYLHKNVCSYFGLQRLCKINGFINIEIKSFGNLNILFEKIFKIYNRIIITYATK